MLDRTSIAEYWRRFQFLFAAGNILVRPPSRLGEPSKVGDVNVPCGAVQVISVLDKAMPSSGAFSQGRDEKQRCVEIM